MDELVPKNSNLIEQYQRGRLVNCRADFTNEVREKIFSIHDAPPWQEYELTGRRTADLEADIEGCTIPPMLLLEGPLVFEWPDGKTFMKILIVHIDIAESIYHINARILQVAQYGGKTRLTASDAHRRLTE